MSPAKAATLVFIALAVAIGLLAARKGGWQTEERFQMATWTRITLPRRPFRDNTAAFQAAFAAMDEVERHASRFLPDSELSAINGDPESWHAISPLFQPMWDKARELYEISQGRFDVTAGGLISLWGFGPDGQRRIPTDQQIAAALARTGFDQVVISNGQVRLPAGFQLDFNALAAGYAADRAAQVLEGLGYRDFLVDAGGEIVCRSRGRHRWLIGIRDPKLPGDAADDSAAEAVALGNGAISTSGSYANFYRQGTNYATHIVDARSGRTTVSPLLSVTVQAPDGLAADGFSTLLFCLPLEEALQTAQDQPDLEALFIVNRNGRLEQLKTSGWK